MAKQYANFIIISGETSMIQEAYSEVIYDIVYSTHKNLRATRKTQYGRGTNFVEAPLSKEEHIRSMYVFYEFSRVSRLTDAERDEDYFCSVKREFEEGILKLKNCVEKLKDELIDQIEYSDDGEFCTITMKPVHTLKAPLDSVFLEYSLAMYRSVSATLSSQISKRI